MIKEEIYIEILNNIHSAVYIVDEDGKVLYINHAVELMDNVKEEEVIGKYILDIIMITNLKRDWNLLQ